MDKNYLFKLPENNLKAICLITAKAVGFNEMEGLDLLEEVKSFVSLTSKEDFLKKFNASDSFVINNPTNALAALKYIVQAKLVDSFPNLYVALRTFLTIPVTVGTAERSFSKLKLIKSFLRFTMTQSRLSSLAVLLIEKEIGRTIAYDNLIAEFAQQKARRHLL